MTEQEAFSKLKEADQQALAYIYEQNRKKCIQFAIKKLFRKSTIGKAQSCSPDEAMELYHEAIIALYQNTVTGRLTELRSKFSTYIISTMKFKWLNQQRKIKLIELEEEVLPIQVEDTSELQGKVREILNEMDGKCKEMLTLRYFLGWGFDDISIQMGYKKDSVVRNLISRCRTKFKVLLTKGLKIQ